MWTQPVKRSKRYKGYAILTYDIEFGMLQVRKNEISLRKWSGGTAHAQMVWWYCACAHFRGNTGREYGSDI